MKAPDNDPVVNQRRWMVGIYPVEVAPGKWLAMAVAREEAPEEPT